MVCRCVHTVGIQLNVAGNLVSEQGQQDFVSILDHEEDPLNELSLGPTPG